MGSYARYKTETLERMREKAWERYRAETVKSCGNWGDGMRLSRLPSAAGWERAKGRLEAIDRELSRRKGK